MPASNAPPEILFMRFSLRLVLLAVTFSSIASLGSFTAADDVIPADAAPRWWKGNLHTHTFWSDGDDFPEMVAEWYRTRGYHFLALTDHNVLAQGLRWKPEVDIVKKGGDTVIPKYLARFGPSWVESRGEGTAKEYRLKPFDEFRALVEERGKFLMIPAEEISDKAEGGPLHINATNITQSLAPVGGATMVEAINNNLRNVHDQAEKAGREILAHLNHPNFHYAVTAHDIAHAVIERHFEVYNGHPGVNHQGDHFHPSTERLWDIANTIRLVDLNAPPLFGIATDDSHSYHGHPKPGQSKASSPGRGWTMVRATHLTPEYIVKAVKAGDCYASSGVMLVDVRFDPSSKTLELEIAPDGDATFKTEFIGSLRGVSTVGEDQNPPEKKGRYSQKYSDKIGEVLATAEGLKASYTLKGNELYVRAVVTSSKPPVNPAFEEQKQQAWTQPVGWTITVAKPVTDAPQK
jgi:predicted metal-dependent phosphoesterase TrpH